jgi:hypothetical protein
MIFVVSLTGSVVVCPDVVVATVGEAFADWLVQTSQSGWFRRNHRYVCGFE